MIMTVVHSEKSHIWLLTNVAIFVDDALSFVLCTKNSAFSIKEVLGYLDYCQESQQIQIIES